jgi:hypothetical protein
MSYPHQFFLDNDLDLEIGMLPHKSWAAIVAALTVCSLALPEEGPKASLSTPILMDLDVSIGPGKACPNARGEIPTNLVRLLMDAPSDEMRG